MYAQGECFTQRNYLKPKNMDKIGCPDQNSCMIAIRCGARKQIKHLMNLTQKSEKQKHL